jgi:5'-nucleotidase/UDP-sugar diphosphatase
MGIAVLSSCVVAALAACGGSDDPVADAPRYEALELNIAHVNDHHSQLAAIPAFEIALGGVPTRVELGGFARLTTLFKQAEDTVPNLLKIHAGDAITGTLYYTFYKGAADAEMMNTVCFDAFALGNHEFDDGDAALASFLDELAEGDCDTPVLAANVKPQVGTPLAPAAADDYILPYATKVVDGVTVGLVGIDISGKTQNSSRPLDTTVFENEVTAAQRAIDVLKADGVRHVVLVTHQGYETDKRMAAELTDVDVIIGGDSHSLLGDFAAQSVASAGPYPTVVTNKDGDTVCIGQAWEYAKAFGLMNVRFDELGAVASCTGQASLVIGDSFARYDGTGTWAPLDDAARAALLDALDAQPAIAVVQPDAAAQAILATYTDRIDVEKARVIGSTSEALCLTRVPGEATNRSAGVAGCEAANALARGSDAAQAVAQAFLTASRRAQFALQNAGGVRIPVPAGPVSMNTAFTLLPFTNVLVELDITGAEVVTALEDAVSNHLDAGQSDGSQPYAAGLRWDLDMSQPRGSRFSNVQVKNRSTGAWSAIDPATTYVMVTNDFIAEGRDGYTTLGEVTADGRSVNTFLLYTQSFADWVQAVGTVARPARTEYSHQQVINVEGVALP